MAHATTLKPDGAKPHESTFNGLGHRTYAKISLLFTLLKDNDMNKSTQNSTSAKPTTQNSTIKTQNSTLPPSKSIQTWTAVAMLFGGFALAVAGFIVPPTGQIHESVLGIFAECLIYAGSIFGVTIYIQTKYTELRSYLDTKLKEDSETKTTGGNNTIHFGGKR